MGLLTQSDVADWHRSRFPGCDPRDVALKLAEEAGEVCRAVLEVRHPTLNGTVRTTSLGDELGDVVIAAYALATRTGIDLDHAVARRWTVIRERG
jgi:NTP pyrophosphatase (non-canonical NTP hydrolase)